VDEAVRNSTRRLEEYKHDENDESFQLLADAECLADDDVDSGMYGPHEHGSYGVYDDEGAARKLRWPAGG
jgi:hypothetical protein